MSQPMDSPSDALDRNIVNQASLVNSGGGNVYVTIHGNPSVSAGEGGSASNPEQVREHERFMEGPSSQNPYISERLCNAVNQQTWETIMRNVTENYQNLDEPNFEVYPQMRKVKNFFDGGFEKWEKEIVIEKEGFGKKILKNQTRKEIGFFYQGEQERENIITKEELVETVLKTNKFGLGDKNPVTAVVASAGSGKTTLLHRIAQEVLNSCPIFHDKEKRQVKETHLKMVYCTDIRHMRFEGQIYPSQFLFEGLYENDDNALAAYKWLIEHQQEAILFFDGLDQATFSIDKSSTRELKPFQKGTASEIMYNILSRKLLPKAKVVIASREFKNSELPAKARPSEIVSLVGFKYENAKKLFIALIKDHGSRIWERIRRLSPRLLNILSVPVFLILTAAIMAIDPEADPPTTITELYNRILLSLPAVENIQERDRIKEVISKLKGMAHHGMKEGRVVFQEADLKKFNLSVKEVQDLMIKVPGNKRLARFLIEGIFDFFFCHQSFQEFLSASFVARMALEDFKPFNDSQLHQSRWSVVRTFVSGIIHDQSTSDLHEVSDPGSKRNIFAKSVLSQMENQEEDVGLLAAIYESNDNELIQSLPRMPSMFGAKIGPNEAFMFGSVLARRGGAKEQIVDLYDCGLIDEYADTIVQSLKGQRIQVAYLDVKFNSIAAKGLNCLLEHFDTEQVTINYSRVSEFRYGQLDWKNIRRISWGPQRQTNTRLSPPKFDMINEGEVVSITGLINGKFTKNDKKLTLQKKTRSHVLDLMIFFEQSRCDFEYQIYVTETKLFQMKMLGMIGKIPEMLLDCRPTKSVDSEMIVSSVKAYGVTCLDILVSSNTSFIPSNFLYEMGSHIGLSHICINVHWWFKLPHRDGLEELYSFVIQNKVKYLRLQCSQHVALEDISAVIKNCNVDKLAVQYWDVSKICYAKKKKEQDALRELARDESIEYEFVDREKFSEEIQNAWEAANRIWIKE